MNFDDLRDVAAEHGWRRFRETLPEHEAHGWTQVWETRDGETWLSTQLEPALELRFVVTMGPDAASMMASVGQAMPLRTPEDALETARDADDDAVRRRVCYELAVLFPSEDPEVMRILRGYYGGGSEPLRRRVASALIYRG